MKKFLAGLYVDDSSSGCHTMEEGYDFYKKAKTVMSEAGFDLRKWASNSTELMQLINKYEQSGNEGDNLQKVLGISWNTESDKLIFDFEELVNEAYLLPPTK